MDGVSSLLWRAHPGSQDRDRALESPGQAGYTAEEAVEGVGVRRGNLRCRAY
jgi:hypothetical protein